MASSREVKRLEAVTRSPVYAMFSASIKGLPTIRAFGATKRFRKMFLDALDINGSWWIAYINCARCGLLTALVPGTRSAGLLPSTLVPLPTDWHLTALLSRSCISCFILAEVFHSGPGSYVLSNVGNMG